MKFDVGDLIQTEVEGVVDCEAIIVRHWITKSEYLSHAPIDNVWVHITFDRTWPEHNGKTDVLLAFRSSRWTLKTARAQ